MNVKTRPNHSLVAVVVVKQTNKQKICIFNHNYIDVIFPVFYCCPINSYSSRFYVTFFLLCFSCSCNFIYQIYPELNTIKCITKRTLKLRLLI